MFPIMSPSVAIIGLRSFSPAMMTRSPAIFSPRRRSGPGFGLGLGADAEPRHLVLAPLSADGLAVAMGLTHRRYAGFINARARRTGQVLQERFASALKLSAQITTRSSSSSDTSSLRRS